MGMKSAAYYMQEAVKVSEQSPDPYKKVGCVGVNDRGSIVAFGYNSILDIDPHAGFWRDREKRRPYMIHAEVHMARMLVAPCYGEQSRFNIVNVYITLFPCVHCMTVLAALEVKKVIYMEAYAKDALAFDVADFYGIKYKQHGFY